MEIRIVDKFFCIFLLNLPVLSFGAQFQNPIKEGRWPDPFCYLHSDGFYYMARSEDGPRFNGIGLYRSPILHDWRNATRAFVYNAPEGLANLWAPEVHYIRGSWYIYFALDDGDNINHRMYVIRAQDPENPMGEWTPAKRLVIPGDDVWAIDGTVFENEVGTVRTLYFVWSGWPRFDSGFPQNIYIAMMSDPETVSGERVLLNEPTLPWQSHGEPLLEGPQILVKGNTTFLVYSASGSWTPDYQLGIMGIDSSADPMMASNWWKHDEPVFWRSDEQSVFGVGHASFTKSIDGSEDWIVFHAMERPDGGWDGRTARIQKFQWNETGFPEFGRPIGFETFLDTPSGED